MVRYWLYMWREMIHNINASWTLMPPASPGQLVEAEDSLGVQLPEELSSLLTETDGVKDEYGLDRIWPIRRIRDDNLMFRTYEDFVELYMPFDHLLFFSDAGNGDQFTFAITGGAVRRPDIFVWNHENDSRKWVAPSLKIFLEWWQQGNIDTS